MQAARANRRLTPTVWCVVLSCCPQLYASLAGFAADMISGGAMLLMTPTNQAATTTHTTNASVPISNGTTVGMLLTAGAAEADNSSSSSGGFWLVPMGEAGNAAAAGLVPVQYQLPGAGHLQRNLQLGTGWPQL
jgi:hypothetical protein